MPFTNDRVIKLRYMGFWGFCHHLKVLFRCSFCLLSCCFLLSFAIYCVKRCSRKNEITDGVQWRGGTRLCERRLPSSDAITKRVEGIKYEISITEYYAAFRAWEDCCNYYVVFRCRKGYLTVPFDAGISRLSRALPNGTFCFLAIAGILADPKGVRGFECNARLVQAIL